MINLVYPTILEYFKKYIDPSKRYESAAFLIWYLENYFRLDEIDAIDSVCDKRQDKGVDGIYYSEGEQIIYIFQSKISQNPNSTIGDKLLREFAGTLDQFRTKENIDIILNGSGNVLLKALINRLSLRDVVESSELRGVFIANVELDRNGEEYLKHSQEIHFIGKNELEKTFIPVERNRPIAQPIEFDISGHQIMEYIIDSNIKCIVTTVNAKELIKMEGIENQSLFDLNVRGPLGKTKVNRDIEDTLKKPEMHKTFPLYHNGITIICNFAEIKDGHIKINNFNVVNGCQSLTVLFNNANYLSDELRVLVRFIKLDTSSDLAEKITKISNNQNGVKPRDFKSNHIIQIRLQNEIRSFFSGEIEYEIKRGEIFTAKEIISNELAGLQLIAFDLKEPWTTHRKYQVFEDKYADIFGRPEVNGYRVVLVNRLYNSIEEKLCKIENKLFGQYTLTKFLVLYILRRIMENDETGKEILKNPNMVFIDKATSIKFDGIMNKVLDDVIIDINEETKEMDVNFDYRGKLREKEYILKFAGEIVSSYEKQINRNRVPSINNEWKK